MRRLLPNRPVVIEAVTDPEVPTLPPHITFEQAMHFSESLLHDSGRKGMVRGAMKDMIAELPPPQELTCVPDSTFQNSEFRSCRSSGAKESGIPAEIFPGRCLSRIFG